MSTCILVMGIPRSGTSAVAGVLHRLGVPMGKNLVPANATINPAGFFEDNDFVSLHGSVTGLDVGHWKRLAQVEPVLPGKLLARYAALIESRNQAHELWGLKDMRVCHFMRQFVNLADNIKVVEVVRCPVSVIRSMRAYPGIDLTLEEALQIYSDWAGLVTLALETICGAGTAMARIRYEALVTEPEHMVDQIAAFVGLPPTEAAVAHIKPELNRSGRECISG